MTPDQIDLARRLVACRRWRWLPGMAYMRRGRPHRVDPEVLSAGGSYDDTCLPDLTDPATAGCLLAMLGRPTTLPAPWVSDWHAGVPLGEAVARALLVAWGAL